MIVIIFILFPYKNYPILFQSVYFEFCRFQISNTKVQNKYWKDTKLDFWLFLAYSCIYFKFHFLWLCPLNRIKADFLRLFSISVKLLNQITNCMHVCLSFCTCQCHYFLRGYQYYILNLCRERFGTSLLSFLPNC